MEMGDWGNRTDSCMRIGIGQSLALMLTNSRVIESMIIWTPTTNETCIPAPARHHNHVKFCPMLQWIQGLCWGAAKAEGLESPSTVLLCRGRSLILVSERKALAAA